MKYIFWDGRGMNSPYILPMIIFCVLFSNPDLLGTCAKAQSQHRDKSPFAQSAGERAAQRAEQKIEPLRIGDTIPDSLLYYKMPIHFDTLGRDSICLADYIAEDKVLIIDFWPTWCAPCVESVIYLDSLTTLKKFKNLNFLSIHVIEYEDRLFKFQERTGFRIPTVYDFSFLVNRVLTRYKGYYGILMLKGNKILGAPDKRTLTVENLDRIEQGKWDELTIAYWPQMKEFYFAKDFGKGGKP